MKTTTTTPKNSPLFRSLVDRVRAMKKKRVVVPVPAHIVEAAKRHPLDEKTAHRGRIHYFRKMESSSIPFNRILPPF